MRHLAASVALLIVLGGLPLGGADAQTPVKADDIFSYQGPDREKRLIEKAKLEGALTI